MVKKKISAFDNFAKDSNNLGSFFLGFGFAIFLINISSFISIIPQLKTSNIDLGAPLLGYYLSLGCSLIIMFASMHFFNTNKK